MRGKLAVELDELGGRITLERNKINGESQPGSILNILANLQRTFFFR